MTKTSEELTEDWLNNKLQAVIYLILKGYCYRSRFGTWLDKKQR